LTTPIMPPGTSTVSPTSMSFPSAPILFDGEPPAPTNADSDACRAMFLLAFNERLGDEAVGWRAGRAPRRLGVCGYAIPDGSFDRVDLFGVSQGRQDGVCFDEMVWQGLDCQRSGD
jgi:hypothetical protein